MCVNLNPVECLSYNPSIETSPQLLLFFSAIDIFFPINLHRIPGNSNKTYGLWVLLFFFMVVPLSNATLSHSLRKTRSRNDEFLGELRGFKRIEYRFHTYFTKTLSSVVNSFIPTLQLALVLLCLAKDLRQVV